MKKLSAILVGMSLVAGAVMAAGPVTSVNIVGYNKITCPKGAFVCVSTAFKSMNGSTLKSSDVFGAQLPLGTTVFAWNPQLLNYTSDSYVEDDEGNPAWGTNVIYRGNMGFWISVPNFGPESYDVTMSGEVPMQSVDTNAVYTGFNLLGYPFTADISWTNTAVAKTAQLGDTLYLWNSASNNYISASYVEDDEGNPGWSEKDLVIQPGMGFWYYTGKAPFFNNEVRPYNP